jgi:hypothetical protein
MSGSNAATIEGNGVARRMIGAEFLKVRKRRGLVVWSVILTVGVVTAVFSILAVLHAENPARYGPAGGVEALSGAMSVLGLLAGVSAILIGAAMGAGDVQAGVFRDLVSTGRSRIALFVARVPGGLAVLWPLVAVGWLVACVASVAFAGSRPHPTVMLMLQGGGWLLVATGSMYALALGLAAFSGSRSTTIGIVLAWFLAVQALLLQITALGSARLFIQATSLNRLMPVGLLSEGRPDPVSGTMSLASAVLLVMAWILVPLAAGAWRTRIRDA